MDLIFANKEQRDRVLCSIDKLGKDVWLLLFQARGWCAHWVGDSECHNVVTRQFIDEVDVVLGYAEKK